MEQDSTSTLIIEFTSKDNMQITQELKEFVYMTELTVIGSFMMGSGLTTHGMMDSSYMLVEKNMKDSLIIPVSMEKDSINTQMGISILVISTMKELKEKE